MGARAGRNRTAIAEKTKQLVEANKQLRELAVRDPLTGLFTRRTFFQSLEKEWQRTRRFHLPMSCVMLDIDFFKRIKNDQAITPLIEMLEDKDWFTRLTAAAALESIGNERGRTAIMPLLKDPDMVVRMRVERILAKWKKQPVSQPATA